jgi:hypothetical protein
MNGNIYIVYIVAYTVELLACCPNKTLYVTQLHNNWQNNNSHVNLLADKGVIRLGLLA